MLMLSLLLDNARYDTNTWYQFLPGRRIDTISSVVTNVLGVGCTPPVKGLGAAKITVVICVLLRLILLLLLRLKTYVQQKAQKEVFQG